MAGAQEAVSCDDPATREVRTLRFSGNRAFTDADLASRIETTPMSWWARVPLVGRLVTRRCIDARTLQLDALRLLYYHRRRGFPEATVDTLVRPLGGRRIAVTFAVREGEPTVIRALRIDGLETVPNRERLLRDLPIAEGRRFDELLLGAARDTLVRRLRNDGHPRADVYRRFTTDRAARTAEVTLDVVPGPLARVGRVRVVVDPFPGRAPQVKVGAVQRLLGADSGDVYRERELVDAQRRAYRTEAFQSVRIELDSTAARGDSIVGLTVTLAENEMRAASVGGGWGTIDCFRAQGTFTHYNLLGGLQRLDVNGRVSRIGVGAPARFGGGLAGLCAQDARRDQYGDTLNYYLGATLRQPGLLGTRLRPEATLYTEQRSEYNAYRRVTPVGLTLALDGWRAGAADLQLAYTLEYGRTAASPALFCVVFTLCAPQDRDIASALRRFAAVTATSTWTVQDDPAFPTRTGSFRLEARHASPAVGADPQFRFNRLIGDLSATTRLGATGILAARLRVGGVFDVPGASRSTQQFIPVQERLFAGGPSTVRGFRPNELGPLSYRVLRYDTVTVNGQPVLEAQPGRTPQIAVPVGGTSMVVGNLEYRVPSPVFGRVAQVALFTDVGQVWTKTDSFAISAGALRWTPGMGLRVVTAFGAIRVDVGYNQYASVAGPAYFDTPLAAGGELLCVSPGALTPLGAPPGRSAACPATYQPLRPASFWRRVTPSISIGQIF